MSPSLHMRPDFFQHPRYPMWVFHGRHAVLLAANRAAARFLGCRRGEVVGRPLKELHPAEQLDVLLTRVGDPRGPMEPSRPLPSRILTKTGRVKPVHVFLRRLSEPHLWLVLVLPGRTGGHGRAWNDARRAASAARLAIEHGWLREQVRVNQRQLKALSSRLLETQEAERRLLALELHDDIGQALTAAKMALCMANRDPDQAEESVRLIEEAIQRVRNLALDLRPSLLDDFGLIPALRSLVDRYAKQTGLSIRLRADGDEGRLSPEREIVGFRIVQEALTNVVRHAFARQVSIDVRKRDGLLHLTIRDNGIGFDVDAALERAQRGSSLGLLGMQERARLIGARLELRSRPGEGTSVHAAIPPADPADRSPQPCERRGRERPMTGRDTSPVPSLG